ncbi:hypothetical protein AAMO2058_001610800 [Amorphochlora amoebiformis]
MFWIPLRASQNRQEPPRTAMPPKKKERGLSEGQKKTVTNAMEHVPREARGHRWKWIYENYMQPNFPNVTLAMVKNYGQYVSRSSAADNPPRVESMDLTHPEAPRTVAPPAAGSPAPPPKWTPAGSSSVSSSSPAVPTASLSVTEARRIIEDRNKKNAEDEFAIYKKICVKDI